MHEATMVRSLVSKACDVARAEGVAGVETVKVRQGRLGHLSPSHLQDHFDVAAAGTLVEGADLVVDTAGDGDELVLVSITVVDR